MHMAHNFLTMIIFVKVLPRIPKITFPRKTPKACSRRHKTNKVNTSTTSTEKDPRLHRKKKKLLFYYQYSKNSISLNGRHDDHQLVSYSLLKGCTEF